MAQTVTRGVFITFEGPEGSGKSTHSERVTLDLLSNGYFVKHTKEPGGDTPLCDNIRYLLLDNEYVQSMDPLAELLLFEADRAEHVKKIIKPELDDKTIVICDRFNTATFAYQGYGLGQSLDLIKAIDDIATGGLKPDLVILLDISPETGLERVSDSKGKGNEDKMEKRNMDFHKKVRDGYLKIAGESPDLIYVIDASGDKEEVYKKVKEKVYDFIKGYTVSR